MIGERHCGTVIVSTAARNGAEQRSTGHQSRSIENGAGLCAFRRSASPLWPACFGEKVSPKTQFLIDRGYRLEMGLNPAISTQMSFLIVAESACCRSDFSARRVGFPRRFMQIFQALMMRYSRNAGGPFYVPLMSANPVPYEVRGSGEIRDNEVCDDEVDDNVASIFLQHRRRNARRFMFVRTWAFALLLIAAVAAPVVTAGTIGSAVGGTVPYVITQQSDQAPAARQLGTIKAIKGSTITLTTDTGKDIDVVVADSARIVSVEPGQKDLKGAIPLQLKDLQVGDRILVRGQASADAKSFAAAGVIAMKHTDLEAKKQHERDEWQKHGIGGLVSAVDPASGTITIGVGSLGAAKTIAVQTTKATVIRRYSPDSVKFDDAKPSALDKISPGDQVRARGVRSADGTTFAADEIVAGSFRNIAGTISAIDASANTVSVTDLITKQPVVVKISTESQIRKLPPEMAQRIAMRMKAGAAGGAPGTAGGAAGSSAQGQAASPAGASGSGAGGGPAGGGGRAPDLQQFLARIPPSTLADLQKGDAVMIVSTEGTASGQVTAITLLAGIEPLLTASPKGAQGMSLSPWSLGGGGEGGGAADANP
jgi:hypothetical protein